MKHIYRELQDKIEFTFSGELDKGLIVSGIVGCGKTSLIKASLESLKVKRKIFYYTGDDSQFRQKILSDTKFLFQEIRSEYQGKTLIFVDEVQKCEEIFDALKFAFDQGEISFIVSGSNPAYLSTVARKRLQRRAEFIILDPISLMELAFNNKFITQNLFKSFENILWHWEKLNTSEFPYSGLTQIPKELPKILSEYFITGGLPLSILAKTFQEKLTEIRLTVERGFELMSVDNNAVADLVRSELAHLHSLEFSYKNIFERARINKRVVVNAIIDELQNHGYLVKRKPSLLGVGRTSYLSIYSYSDPGIVSYLTAEYDFEYTKGSRVEGYVHSRLWHRIVNSPLKAELGYFKPYTIDANNKVKYTSGEIDFIFTHGRRIIPIEVKANLSNSEISTSEIETFVKKRKCPFGVILYGGLPQIDKEKNILFWPYWLI